MTAKKTLFACLTLLLATVLAEGGARMLMMATGVSPRDWRPGTVRAGEPYPTVLYQAHPFLPYALRPSLNVESSPPRRGAAGAAPPAIDFRTNAWGGRGGEIELPKPPGTLRIAALGGSTTFGWTRSSDSWTTRLEELLTARLEAGHLPTWDRVEVLNFGTPKATSVYSLVTLATRVIHLEPDLVLVYHGINDVSNWRFEGLRPDYSHVSADLREIPRWIERVPSWAFRSALVTAAVYGLAQRHERDFAERRNLVETPRWQERNLRAGLDVLLANYRSMRGLCEAHGTRFATATFHILREQGAWGSAIRELNRELRAWATEEGVPLADLAAEIPHGDRSLHSDAAHFTAAGHRRVAEVFAELLEREMMTAPRGSDQTGRSVEDD